MIIVLHIVQGLLALWALSLLAGYSASKHWGMLLAGNALGFGVLASFHMSAWWPLGAGLAALVILRVMGLDPGADA
jgi:hypothetical protein